MARRSGIETFEFENCPSCAQVLAKASVTPKCDLIHPADCPADDTFHGRLIRQLA
jgi:hypothetical protein